MKSVGRTELGIPMDATELLESMALPYAHGRPSILSLVRVAAARAQAEGAVGINLELPEEAVEQDAEEPERVRFAAGALDALIGGPDDTVKQTMARTLVAALRRLLRYPSADAFAGLCRLLKDGRTSAIVDETIERIAPELDQRRESLGALARRLVQEAPDVEAVKMGVALLGVSGAAADETLILEIGQYDEITLYSAVALANLLDDPEDATWRLAQRVRGWGRITAVERLAKAQRPEIKAWLLRDGFRNDIMFEYLAFIAATTGEMLNALSKPAIDDELLVSVSEILGALIMGGPAEQIEDYMDAVAACGEFLRHALLRDAPALTVVSTVSAIQRLTEGEGAERLKKLPGCSAEALLEIRVRAGALMQKPGARAAVEAGLRSEEAWGDIFVAADLAPRFGIDPWPVLFNRQRRGIGESWWHLMQTEDASRVQKVLALAREQLDLSRVGLRPTRGPLFGPGHKDDRSVDFIVQDLRRFPGVGADFIELSLRRRSVRLQQMAINALRDWGRDNWPAGAEGWVRAALNNEPEQDVRTRLEALLDDRRSAH